MVTMAKVGGNCMSCDACMSFDLIGLLDYFLS